VPRNLGARGGPVPGGALPAVASSRCVDLAGRGQFPTSYPVSGAITVEMGTEEETEEAVRTALQTLGAGGGFILSPVDNIREDTETARRNTHRFIEAWKRYRAVP